MGQIFCLHFFKLLNVEELTMKNKKILLLTITLVISVSQIDAMGHLCQQVIVRNFGKRLTRGLPKEIAKKAFSKTMTGLHWGISAGPMIGIGIFQGIKDEIFGVKLPPEAENVNCYVKGFAQNILGTENANAVMGKSNSGLEIQATHRHIFINKDTLKSMSKLLQDYNTNECCINSNILSKKQKKIVRKEQQQLQPAIDALSFVLHHEHNHRQELDSLHFFIASFAIPFLVVHPATHIIGRKVLPFAKSSCGVKWLARELSKIPTGFAKLLISCGLYMTYRIHREQEADNKVPNDKAILQGGLSGLAYQENYKKKLVPNSKKAWKFSIVKWLDMHPSNEKRIKKLEERIKRLDS